MDTYHSTGIKLSNLDTWVGFTIRLSDPHLKITALGNTRSDVCHRSTVPDDGASIVRNVGSREREMPVIAIVQRIIIGNGTSIIVRLECEGISHIKLYLLRILETWIVAYRGRFLNSYAIKRLFLP